MLDVAIGSILYRHSASPQLNASALLRALARECVTEGRLACLVHAIGRTAISHAVFLESMAPKAGAELGIDGSDWLSHVKSNDMTSGLLFQMVPIVQSALDSVPQR